MYSLTSGMIAGAPNEKNTAVDYVHDLGAIVISRESCDDDNAMDLDEQNFVTKYGEVWNSSTRQAVLKEGPAHFATSGKKFVVGCGEIRFAKTGTQEFGITGFRISRFIIRALARAVESSALHN